MRLTTKITGLTALLAALLVAVVGYQVAQVRSLAAVTDRLSTTVFSAAELEIEIERHRTRIDDLTRRLWVLRDADYLPAIAAAQRELGKGLDALGHLPLSPQEDAALAALATSWESYRRAWAQLRAAADVPTQDGATLEALASVGADVETLRAATERSIQALRARSEAQQRQAERVSWLAALAAVGAALPVVALLLHSVRRPLRRLVRGTRTLAAGRFPDRIEAEGADEIAELAESFNEMVTRLEELEGLKRDFVAHISHELRTPLVAMRETTEVMLEELAGPLTPRQRRLLELNADGVERLRARVDRLLDLARMEAGAMEYDPEVFDLPELTRETVASLTAAQARVRLHLAAGELPVRGDRERVRQVIENLVVNALKYSPEQEPVDVTVTVDDDGVLLAVADRGPGIEEADRQLIFEKFHRTTRGSRPGFGLGLAICREIVNAHGGTLWVEDREPAGSRFCVRLGPDSRAAE